MEEVKSELSLLVISLYHQRLFLNSPWIS